MIRLIGNLAVLLWAIASLSILAAEDEPFERVKQEFREAPCTQIDFLAILESDVFETVDTGNGTVYIAADGRYLLETGVDIYLFDGQKLYSYSQPNNQVVVERVGSTEASPYELSLLRQLDEFYETHIITPGREYRLIRQSEKNTELPDSMVVYLNAEDTTLERMEYFDLNDDLNRIVIQSYENKNRCEPRRFEPQFPDSVETIEL